jgi:NADH:ubiquinone oxidoreductase subunit 11 or 4L (chain K)
VTSIVLLVAPSAASSSAPTHDGRTPMHGPDITAYVVLAALLFATGVLGVTLRRSPLIILLSVEIMLNAANLLLIAFARLHGREDGQVFAVSVMAVPRRRWSSASA